MNRLISTPIRRYFSYIDRSKFDELLKSSKNISIQISDASTQIVECKDFVTDIYAKNQIELFRNMETAISKHLHKGEEIDLTISSNIGVFNSTLSKRVKKNEE